MTTSQIEERLRRLEARMRDLATTSPGSGRVILSANTTFTLESLGGTVAAAWANLRDNYDLRGFRVRIQMPASYIGSSTIEGPLTGQVRAADVEFYGDAAAPGNYLVSDVTPGAMLFYVAEGARFAIRGVTLRSSGFGVIVSDGAVTIWNTWFGSCGQACLDVAGGRAQIVGRDHLLWLPESFTTAAVSEDHGLIALPCNLMISGSPSFSNAFVQANLGGMIDASGAVVSPGACTGKRFNAEQNGIIFTGGTNSPDFFPGNVAGTVSTGGCYQ
jgi:hypothetical protein